MPQILSSPIPLPKYQLAVMGKEATANEYNVAVALTQANLYFIFRASFFGGRRIRGGVELDFLVFAPFPTPLEVFGNYWHTGQFDSNDKYRLAILQNFFKTKPVVIWGNESETVEDARTAVRRKLFR